MFVGPSTVSWVTGFPPHTSPIQVSNLGLSEFNIKDIPAQWAKLDKDLIFSGLVQNVYVYRMAKSKKI